MYLLPNTYECIYEYYYNIYNHHTQKQNCTSFIRVSVNLKKSIIKNSMKESFIV